MAFQLKSFTNILSDMIAKFLAQTGLTDVNPGSVLSTFLEAAAQEDAAAYYQMYQIIRNYNLDTTEGDDLENRAKELGLDPARLPPQKASGTITISDSAVVQKKTKIYSGSRGPVVGQVTLDVDNAGIFTASGTVIVGRGTTVVETVPYSSITDFGNFFRLNLLSAFTNDHGTDESVILAQGGNRVIESGTIVRVPASDTTDEIQFITTQQATILDGDSIVENIPIQAVLAGGTPIPAGAITEFDSLPFNTAVVSNPSAINNGTDLETDDQLRDRIRRRIQSLSKANKASLLDAVIGLTSSEDNKRIVSANLIDSITLNDLAFLYVDDGTGLEPSFAPSGNEVLVANATGGEKFLQLDFFPVIKAEVKTENAQPFNIIAGNTLTVKVNEIEETLIFSASDYQIPGALTAYEITRAINSKMTTIEARTANGGTKVSIRAIDKNNETLQVTGGTANTALLFPTAKTETVYLYKYDGSTITLLNKDGKTAFVESGNAGVFALFGGESLTIIIDGKTANTQTVTFIASDFLTPGAATPTEISNKINSVIAGATAFISDGGTRISIKSNTENSILSKIQITGGTANVSLNFSTSEVVGFDKDYTLNRFQGTFELNSPAVAGEKYETGSTLTRGFLVSANAQPFSLLNGDTITFKVDGGGNQVVTFNTADFVFINNATAAEVVAVLNKTLLGATATVTSDNRVMVKTNTYATTGSIKVEAQSGNAFQLGFTVGTIITSLSSHMASLVSGSAGPYTFSEGQFLDIVINNDTVNNQFKVIMDLDGIVTVGDAAGPFTTFIANITSIAQNFNIKFTNTDDLKDFKVKWLTGDNAPTVSTVSAYNASTGQFTIGALGNSIDVGDTFTIIPATTKNVVTYMSNNVVSSLFSVANVESSNNGTKVQITSTTPGTVGAVQVTGGTANAVLNFSTTEIVGVDGYKYYTGILQLAQHTIDGLNTDLSNFPGTKAVGPQVEVLAPIVRLLQLEINLTLEEGVLLNTIKDKITNSISAYVNSLGVGNDVILSEITDVLMSIDGIRDVIFVNPSENIAIADNELPRVSVNDLVFG